MTDKLTKEKLDELEEDFREFGHEEWTPEDALSLIAAARASLGVSRARPASEWHEGIGDALWWKFPVNEAPYSGSPLDTEWPGYHTHWTPIPSPPEPTNGR